MAQTTYATTMSAGFPGMKGDLAPGYVRSYSNAESSAEIPFGVIVAQGATENAAKLPAAATDKLVGVVLHSHDYDPSQLGTTGIKIKNMMSVMSKGTVWVKTETAVSAGDRVYVRHTASGGNTVLGAARNQSDATAEVKTITPTAANDTVYGLDILIDAKLFHFVVTSDSSATATEIVTLFKTAMAANAAFTALVVATGTATLILTAQVAGLDMSVTSTETGTLAIADTTEGGGATGTLELKGARYLTTSSAGAAMIECDFNVIRATQA